MTEHAGTTASDGARGTATSGRAGSGGTRRGGEQELTVAILAGGLTHERDVSMRSGRRVAEVLRDEGCEVHVLDVDFHLLPRLAELKPDVVWPLVHGSTGEDGSLQNLLDLTGLPYVGSTAGASRLASDKPVAKALATRAGLATPAHAALPQSIFREVGARAVLETVERRLGLPLVVKPAGGGSALGVSLVESSAALPDAMVHCFAYGEVALLERYVSGTEVAVSVIDVEGSARALPAVEIETEGAYDFDARYNPGRSQFFAPARLDETGMAAAHSLAVSIHEALGLRHLSRTDAIVDAAGTAWLIDVNVAPGMTETSLFPQAAIADQRDLNDIYLDLVRTAARG